MNCEVCNGKWCFVGARQVEVGFAVGGILSATCLARVLAVKGQDGAGNLVGGGGDGFAPSCPYIRCFAGGQLGKDEL